jgi:ADP-ribosylglycohydrolase
MPSNTLQEESAMDKAISMVLGSFLGDSLALGAHWIYDQAQIKRQFGRVEGLLPPAPGSYHPGKLAGDLTHYGDQTLLLLRSLAKNRGFQPADFSADWRAMFEGGYAGYVDRATKNTLGQLAAGWDWRDAGSGSDDLAGASRIAPLCYLLRGDVEAMAAACRLQTSLTHNNAKVVDSAEFFARTVHAVLGGETPVAAMETALDGRFPGSPLHGWLKDGVEAAGEDSPAAIAGFGQSCHVDGAFQSTVHLIARHPDDPATALIDSVMAGGDSAARNMLAGMVLCARKGIEALPAAWLSGLACRREVEALLAVSG